MELLFSTLLLATAASAQSFLSEFTDLPSFTESIPTPTESFGPITTPSFNPDEPCSQVAELVLSGEERFPPETVFDCLNSVPVDKEGDEKLIDELKIVWQWESDGGWIKNPPDSWELGPLDIEKELDEIKSNLDNFKSEYEVQLAIQKITIRSGNFHFNYRPDILRIFRFWRPFGVTSLSDDGKSLPKLYVDSDALSMAASDTSNFSNIEQINGQDAWKYLKTVADLEQFLDQDSRMANVLTPGGDESVGGFQVQYNYHGGETEVKFANGSTSTYENYARFGMASELASVDFNETVFWLDVYDGPSLFQTFCQGGFTGEDIEESLRFGKTDDDTQTTTEPMIAQRLDDRPVHVGKIRHRYGLDKRQIPENYPIPVVSDPSDVVAGYFLQESNYKDVAVLKVISFAPEESPSSDFQDAVSEFLEESRSQNKKKLIIDLRENGGGEIQLYLDLFLQLFPKDKPFSGQYYRAQEQFTAMGDAISKLVKENEEDSESIKEFVAENLFFWAWWSYTTGKGDSYFKSWDDLKGPVRLNGDNFTTLFQWSLENSYDNVLLSSFQFYNDTSADPPFDPKNIVMLTDGLCGSACAAFAENMKNIAGVQTITVGSRPEKKPMQGVAGSKGGQVVPLARLPLLAIEVIADVSDLNTGIENTKVADLADIRQVMLRAGDERTRLQIKEHLRKGDDTGTPLEFTYEAADCKIYYTAKSWTDPAAIWTQTWDAYNDNKNCAEGSTKHESSLSGGYKPFGKGEVKDEDLPKNQTSQEGSEGGENNENKEENKPKGAASSLQAGGFAVVMAAVVGMSLQLL